MKTMQELLELLNEQERHWCVNDMGKVNVEDVIDWVVTNHWQGLTIEEYAALSNANNLNHINNTLQTISLTMED